MQVVVVEPPTYVDDAPVPSHVPRSLPRSRTRQERNRHACEILAHGLPNVEAFVGERQLRPGLGSRHRDTRGKDHPADPCASFDYIFWAGDMNYRLGKPLDVRSWRADAFPEDANDSAESRAFWHEMAALIAQSDWAQLQRHDQLQRQIEHGQAFCGFDAATETLCFAPTFKMSKPAMALAREKLLRRHPIRSGSFAPLMSGASGGLPIGLVEGGGGGDGRGGGGRVCSTVHGSAKRMMKRIEPRLTEESEGEEEGAGGRKSGESGDGGDGVDGVDGDGGDGGGDGGDGVDGGGGKGGGDDAADAVDTKHVRFGADAGEMEEEGDAEKAAVAAEAAEAAAYLSDPRSRYDSRRIPSWCDRVLSLAGPGGVCIRTGHGAASELRFVSDHEPVWSTFRVQYHAPVPRLRHDSSGGGWGGGGIGGASLGFGGGGLGLAEALAEEAHRFGLGFESSSDLRIEVSSLRVRVDLSALLSRSCAWADAWGKIWPSPQAEPDFRPKLRVELVGGAFDSGRKLMRKRVQARRHSSVADVEETRQREGRGGDGGGGEGGGGGDGRGGGGGGGGGGMRRPVESVALLAEWERQTFGVRSRFAREIKQTSATRPLPLALHVSAACAEYLVPLGTARLNLRDIDGCPNGHTGTGPRTGGGTGSGSGSTGTGHQGSHAGREAYGSVASSIATSRVSCESSACAEAGGGCSRASGSSAGRGGSRGGASLASQQTVDLIWCGVRCGTITYRLRFRGASAAPSTAGGRAGGGGGGGGAGRGGSGGNGPGLLLKRASNSLQNLFGGDRDSTTATPTQTPPESPALGVLRRLPQWVAARNRCISTNAPSPSPLPSGSEPTTVDAASTADGGKGSVCQIAHSSSVASPPTAAALAAEQDGSEHDTASPGSPRISIELLNAQAAAPARQPSAPHHYAPPV